MIFNCEHYDCKTLTPEYIDTASGLDLHQLRWTTDKAVGFLPLEWNHLVGHYPWKKDVKAVHFTEGGPYFNDYRDCDYNTDWWEAFHAMTYVKNGIHI